MNSKIAFIWMVNSTERLVGIHSTLKALSECVHRGRMDIWIACSSLEIEWRIGALLHKSPYRGESIRTINVNDTSWHGYKKKIAAIANQYPYFIKCDDDLFYGHHTLDFFIEHVPLLDDPERVWLFPVSSINSLTTDIFIEDFIDEEATRQALYQDFAEFDYRQYPDQNGTDDLRPLKAFLGAMDGWKPEALRQYMLDTHHFNGGEHPIRHSNSAITRLNAYIIDHIDRIFEPQPCQFVPYPGFYQAQFYAMSSRTWFHVQKLVQQEVIPRGLIDETEINWYVKYNHKTPLMARHAYVIHPALIGVDLKHYHRIIYQAVQRHFGG